MHECSFPHSLLRLLLGFHPQVKRFNLDLPVRIKLIANPMKASVMRIAAAIMVKKRPDMIDPFRVNELSF